MARSVSYQVIQRPEGHFDIAVTLAGGRTHFRQGLATRTDVDTALNLLRDLMAACDTALVEKPLLHEVAE